MVVGRGDAGRCPGRPLRQQGVKRLGPVALERLIPARAHLGWRRRAQRELGQSAARSTGRCRRSRSEWLHPPGAGSIWTWARGRVFGDAETRVDRQERHEAVLEDTLLRGGGDAGEQFEAGVDLQRVRRDRDRRVPTRPQAGREREREPVLPTPVGPKSAITDSDTGSVS